MARLDIVASLLFELASEPRLELLSRLSQEPTRLSLLAKEIGITIQETSRHLGRLCDSLLATKNADGLYLATPLGHQLVELLPIFDFLFSNREYFSRHDISALPLKFVYGFGLMTDYGVSNHVMDSFKYAEDAVKNAERFIWIQSDQVLSSTTDAINDAVDAGMDFRLILPKSLVTPQEPENDSAVQDTHVRVVDSVGIVMVITEKCALLSFPRIGGEHDYHGFLLENQETIRWCQLLFQDCWDNASPLVPL